jgi:uncharacterized MAPEG superfamily protein
MPIAYWCILACVLMPYFLSVAARSSATRAGYVRDPRAYDETLTGWRRRAHLASLNAFEAVPSILAGVVVAELSSAPRFHVDFLAALFVAFRILHAGLYIADRPMLRSHAWRLGILCVIALFVVAATQGQFPSPRF